MEHKIIQGNAINKYIPYNSIDLIVTSPPYWNIKDYGSGKHSSYNRYLKELKAILHRCLLYTKPGRKICINIGDIFVSSKYTSDNRFTIYPLFAEIITYMFKIGTSYEGDIRWHKTKYDGRLLGSFPYPPNGCIKQEYEHILIFRKKGKSPISNRYSSKINEREWWQLFNPTWTFRGKKDPRHPAPFPIEIPCNLIKMYSLVGETVLDPFAGSGTTSLAAECLKRNSIAIEINKEYVELIHNRLRNIEKEVYHEHRFQIPGLAKGN